ncbi:hypothetical protein [Halonatronum saccharophilum]|uniref:hypothetical protein n=1 Tax=Halonatronum saccharophilum TaxID=150060 RepID=UPI000480CCF9|nr:hypothetical protein [Halonatronum saccharophilum]
MFDYLKARKMVYLVILALLIAVNIYLWGDTFRKDEISPRAKRVFNQDVIVEEVNLERSPISYVR